MNTCKLSTPLMLLAALVLSGSVALSQAPPPASPPAPPTSGQPAAGQAAPVERRPPTGPGMGPMRPDMRHGRPEMRTGMQGHGGGGGNPHSARMDGGFHIIPPGMWWKSPGIVERLTLTPVQTKKMDDIFQASRIQLIDLKANVEKQDVLLEPMLSANPPDMAKAMAQIDKVAQARAELEKADAKMLLGIRGVLTPEQWTKLQARGEAGGPGRAAGPGTPDGMHGPGGGPRGSGGGGGTLRDGGENLVAPDIEP